MELVIDTRNGLAGDIMSAGLIGLGGFSREMTRAMESAGNMLGKCKVTHEQTDGIHRLNIILEERAGHLHASEARDILESSLRKHRISEPWDAMGRSVLEALISAESHVHAHHPSLKQHFHGHEAVLHEAADIIIDIMGMATGMMELNVRTVKYLDYVNVGSGTVNFSHGTLEVPTPATRRILGEHQIAWKNTPSGMEMATPTGAAILAGCNAQRIETEPRQGKASLARGTRTLPPVRFFLLK
jgi:hypothetical protein